MLGRRRTLGLWASGPVRPQPSLRCAHEIWAVSTCTLSASLVSALIQLLMTLGPVVGEAQPGRLKTKKRRKTKKKKRRRRRRIQTRRRNRKQEEEEDEEEQEEEYLLK